MASHQSPPKKPRLSLQINPAVGPAARAPRGFSVDPKDPTTFNTLSNAYVTAIERSTPLTAINTLQAFSLNTPVEYKDSKMRVTTPYIANYPETPLSAHADSPLQPMQITYPSAMTATPPLSAGPADANSSKVFTFSPADTANSPAAQTQVSSPITPARRRPAPYQLAGLGLQPPYSHPRTLHSILRNSPLPPRTAIPPQSPRRQSLRLQEKANKKVEYHSPLTQDIVTQWYTKSHIDLLAEEASPASPANLPSAEPLDLAMAFTAQEIEDGGQTPGPYEEVRRRIAGLPTGTPTSPSGPNGIRKRKRKEKKRRWVWTIGQEEEEEVEAGSKSLEQAKPVEDEAKTPMGPVPQITYLQTPTPSIESDVSATTSASDSFDVEMSDTSSVYSEERGLTPMDAELELKTPTAPKGLGLLMEKQEKRDTPIPELTENRDTPVPPEMG